MGVNEIRLLQRQVALEDKQRSATDRDEAHEAMGRAIAERFHNHIEAVDLSEEARKEKNKVAMGVGLLHGIANFIASPFASIDPVLGTALAAGKAALWGWATKEVVGEPFGEKANDDEELGSANFREKSRRAGIDMSQLELIAGEASRSNAGAREEAAQIERLADGYRAMEDEAARQLGGTIEGTSRSSGASRVRLAAARSSQQEKRADRVESKALRLRSIDAQRLQVTLENEAEKETIRSSGWKAFAEASGWVMRAIGYAAAYWTAGVSIAAAESGAAGAKWAAQTDRADNDIAAANMKRQAGHLAAMAVVMDGRAERLEEAADQAAGLAQAVGSGEERLLRELRRR